MQQMSSSAKKQDDVYFVYTHYLDMNQHSWHELCPILAASI